MGTVHRKAFVTVATAFAAIALVLGFATPADAGCYRCTKYVRHDVWKSPSGATECRLGGSQASYVVWCRITSTNTLIRWRAGYDGYTAGSYRVSKATSAQRALFRNAYRVKYRNYFRMGLDDPQSWAPAIGCVVTTTDGSECYFAPLMNGPQVWLRIKHSHAYICDADRYRTPVQRCRKVD